jgi:serine/threonine protein kinase
MEILDTVDKDIVNKDNDKEITDFELVRDLGSGAYGKVFCIKSGMDYRALKVQEYFDPKDGTMIAGSVREHVFFSQFPPHPNILSCKSIWRVKENLFFSLPLYSCDLCMLSRLCPLTFYDFLYIARSLCNGLKAMHDANWMHRDFKLENVLVDAKRGVCISDFNLVRFCGIDIPFADIVTKEDKDKDTRQGGRDVVNDDKKETKPQISPKPAKNVLQLSVNATTEVCSLWTRPPEVVLQQLIGKSRTSYGLEFDMFSLGATLLGMLANGEYVAGSKIRGRGESSEEKYISACLDLIGVDNETMALYGPYSNAAPSTDKCIERVKRFINQPCWSPQQKDIASLLIVGLLHPNPKTRFTWKDVEEWFSLQEQIPTSFSYSVIQILATQKAKSRTSKSFTLDFSITEEPTKKQHRNKNTLNLETFWNLCGNCTIPPFVAIEALRLKFGRGYSIQESQSLLFILECVHGYVSANISSQLCYISPEDIWYVLESLPTLDSQTIQLAASLRSHPFKLCCLAAEIAITGKCENPEKLEETKLMHLSTASPYFASYGNYWKSQKDLRSTWLRLLTLGMVNA